MKVLSNASNVVELGVQVKMKTKTKMKMKMMIKIMMMIMIKIMMMIRTMMEKLMSAIRQTVVAQVTLNKIGALRIPNIHQVGADLMKTIVNRVMVNGA